MDLIVDKIDIAKFRGEEVALVVDEILDSRADEVSAPLRGVLIGLILSIPIWLAGFILFELF